MKVIITMPDSPEYDRKFAMLNALREDCKYATAGHDWGITRRNTLEYMATPYGLVAYDHDNGTLYEIGDDIL